MYSMQQKMEQLIVDVAAHGYGICDDFLTTAEVSQLVARLKFRYEEGAFNHAKVGKLTDASLVETIRGDQILWLEEDSSNASERIILDKNLVLIDYINASCYLGIKHCEIHFAKYEEGKFYKRHRDSFEHKKGRVLSIIYYLNTAWQPDHGGNLVIYTNLDNVEQAISIAPLAGRLICFESEKLEHEVLATTVNRYSITGWMVNR
jgi:SM-20-related protein